MTRITIRLDDQLRQQVKELAARSGRTFTEIVQDALRQAVRQPAQDGKKPRKRFRLPTTGAGGLQPGVNIDDSAGLLAIMEEGVPLEKLR